jgi:hypothetical protein
MKITREFLNKGGTKNGYGYSWLNKQVYFLGEVKTKGWFTRLIGKEITEEQAKQFLELNPNRSELLLLNKGFEFKQYRINKGLEPYPRK